VCRIIACRRKRERVPVLLYAEAPLLLLAVAAKGLQNALMRVTQSAIDVVTMLGRNVDPATDAQIVAFTVGAAAGAMGCALVGLGLRWSERVLISSRNRPSVGIYPEETHGQARQGRIRTRAYPDPGR